MQKQLSLLDWRPPEEEKPKAKVERRVNLEMPDQEKKLVTFGRVKPGGYWRIEQMMEQVGALSKDISHNCFAYIGATNPVYKAREDDALPDPSRVGKDGMIEYQVGLQFNVNIKPGWKMIVTLEPSDTYTVRLWRQHRRDTWLQKDGTMLVGEVIEEMTDVYCDELQEVVEKIYDQAIHKYNRGGIPI